MRKAILFAIAVSVLQAQEAREIKKSVEFTVRVEKEVEADLAVVKLTLNREESTLSQATESCAKAVGNVKAALKKAGVDTGAVRTRVVSSLPRFGFFSGKVKSYRVEGQVEARIKDIKRLPDILSSLNGLDKDLVIQDLSFKCADEDSLRAVLVKEAAPRAEVLKKAYENAFIVKLFLFRIQDFSELIAQPLGGAYPRMEKMMAMAGAQDETFVDAVPVLKYEMRLQVVYEMR